MDGVKMDFSASSLEPFFMAATTAALIGLAVPFLQTDFLSRHFLSVEQIRQKRRKEYEYRWSFLLEKLLVTSLHKLGDDDNLILLVQDQEIQEFIETKCLGEGEHPQIVAIGIDEKLKTRDVCVWIFLPSEGLIYQAPFQDFGLRLHATIQSQPASSTSTAPTMCFVTDASGGAGSSVIASVVEQCDLQVSVIREPQWMAMFAKLVHEGFIARETLEKCLFGFTHLDALSSSSPSSQTIQTVCVTVPGQAVSAVLMPLLPTAFPAARHIFVYDTCHHVVGRTLVTRKMYESSQPSSYRCVSPVTHTTPMVQHLPPQIQKLPTALAKLPLNLADTTEAWMASMDAFLKAKETNGAKECSSPLLCKLDHLLVEGNDQDAALQRLLQFLTGAPSLPEGAVPHAVEVLKSTQVLKPPVFSLSLYKAIEDCVFCHKGILRGDVTLGDTTTVPRKD